MMLYKSQQTMFVLSVDGK